MPIEDADKVHSKRGQEGAAITIFGKRIGFMKLMFGLGIGIAVIFLSAAAYYMMLPAPVPPVVETPNVIVINDTKISFDIINTSYNYRIIKMSYAGNKPIPNIQAELLLSMYPPQSTHYVQRQSIANSNISSFDTKNNTLYIYTGVDNAFHMSNNMPKYSECVDFINGEWSLNVDNNITQMNMYNFKFTIADSKTYNIENGMRINESIQELPDRSTAFIYQGVYKERIALIKSIRLIGINSPLIDAGGFGSGISVYSNNNTISGLIVVNSGNREETANGGIVVMSSSSGNTIIKNEIYRTLYGIVLYKSPLNIVTNNTIHDNDKYGIFLFGSSSNILTNNSIYLNIDGIRVNSESNYNMIHDNNVHDNDDYGIIIDNYKNLGNICEYNIYKNNKMSCSDAIDRDQQVTTNISGGVITPKITPTTNYNTDGWEDCKNNPKCYQS